MTKQMREGGRWGDREEKEGKETRRGGKGGSRRGRQKIREGRGGLRVTQSKGKVELEREERLYTETGLQNYHSYISYGSQVRNSYKPVVLLLSYM